MDNTVSKIADSLLPIEMARKCEFLGEKKANLNFASTLVLSILAGAFIGLGGMFYTVAVTTGDVEVSFGTKKLLGGLAFSLGLILVIVAGAELFTGNNLISMAWASRRISTKELIRNWSVVYVGNFIGSVGIASLAHVSNLADQGGGAVGQTMLSIAEYKCELNGTHAFAAGIGCNVLVCLAVWLCLSARSVTDKIVAIVFPITAFVATGMEHCVANMYFIPVAMMGELATDSNSLTIGNFILQNLIPVTLGNIFGGSVLVGLVYWFVYLRNEAIDSNVDTKRQ